MRSSLSAAFALAIVLVFSSFGAEQAVARSKKQVEPSSGSSIMVDEGTPIIMQGLERPKRAVQGGTKEATKEQEPGRRVHIPRGSASFVPPISSVTPLPRTPLLSQQGAVAPYNPPPISNPSERITNFNHSFEFNKGLGNNPTDRDGYVRYNFNR
jgi:hypothetical protein